MLQTVEVYEQGTGKLIDTYEQEIPDPEPSELEVLKAEVAGMQTEIEALKTEIELLKAK